MSSTSPLAAIPPNHETRRSKPKQAFAQVEKWMATIREIMHEGKLPWRRSPVNHRRR